MNQTLTNNLEEAIIEAGFFSGHYHQYNKDGIDLADFIESYLSGEGAMTVQTITTEGFDSPGYECSVLSVAWVDKNGLHLETWLLEEC